MSTKAKSGKPSANPKTEIAEKVKEIKQRQQNWLKQRQTTIKKQTQENSASEYGATKSSSPSSSLVQSGRITKSSSTLSSASATSTQFSHSSSASSNKNSSAPPVAKTYTKLQKWTKPESESITVGRDSHKLNSDTEEEFYKGNNNYGYHDYRASDYRKNGRKNQETARNAPIAPELFDTLADKILMRVKNELQIEQGRPKSRKEVESECEELGDQLGESGYGLDSHRCHHCSVVMAAPDHSAMLVIPCGHTYCRQCLDGTDQCPGCQCAVQSLTCNIMLQQIISEYLRQKDMVRGKSSSSRHSRKYSGKQQNLHNQYSASNYTEDNDRDYNEEYRTLSIRSEVLESEKDNINHNIGQVDRQIKTEERQIRGIQNEEDRIQTDIRNLEIKLNDLKKHREDYEERISELERKKDQERRKIEMVDKTLQGIRSDMNEIRAFAGDVHSD